MRASSLRARACESPLITIVMSRVIEADQQRVWSALTDPTKVTAWDERALGAVDPAPDYPFTRGGMRWRYRLGHVPLILHDHPIEVVPGSRLKRKVSLGSLRYEQTFTLTPVDGDATHTVLGLKLVTRNWIPLVGDTVDRFSARKLATEHVDETLRQVQAYFESPSARG